MPTLIILALLALTGFYMVSVYNGLVVLRNRVKNAWAQIDVQLKNRADLIPNLVETVKGYAAHEKTTFENVVNARNRAVNAKNPEEAIEGNNMLTEALNRLMVVVEAYPELKANSNFISLQAELKDVEEKIRYSRQFYNDTVLKYNNGIQVFPKNILAGMFNFREEPFFKVSEGDKEVPKVKF
ncbi:MAG TPA: LemA family protein [Thermoanaerobacterales bacterium]|jgi:LemA protein|nr:LemA family protein [Thermoanaerobacterales bacterium]